MVKGQEEMLDHPENRPALSRPSTAPGPTSYPSTGHGRQQRPQAPLRAPTKSLRLDDVRKDGKVMGGTIGPHTRSETPAPSVGKTRDGQGLNSRLPRKTAFCTASPNLVVSPDLLLHSSVCAKSLESCLTLCDPADCSLPGSPVHGTL